MEKNFRGIILVVFCVYFCFYTLNKIFAQEEGFINSFTISTSNSHSNLEYTPLKTITTFIPYTELTKLLTDAEKKYIVLPYNEFENLRKNKIAEIEQESKTKKLSPPIKYRFISLQINGEVEKNHIIFYANYNLESFTDDWNTVNLLSGCLAIEKITINDIDAPIVEFWDNQLSQQKFENQQINNWVKQNNWYDVNFVIPFKGKGKHKINIKFVVPIKFKEGTNIIEFSTYPVPLTTINIFANNQKWKVEEVSFADWNVEIVEKPEIQNNFVGTRFFGCVGINSYIKIVWKVRQDSVFIQDQPQHKTQTQSEAIGNKIHQQQIFQESKLKELVQQKEPIASITTHLTKPKSVPQPIVYAKSENLITISDNVVNGKIDIDLQIVRSSISSITLLVPNYVEITSIKSDRPVNFYFSEDGKIKKVFVDFQTNREELCPLYISYEIKLDENTTSFEIPDIHPINIEREVGFIAVQSLVSLEIVAGNNSQSNSNNAIKIDPQELPETFKRKAFRPVLMAYRIIKRPTNLIINFRKYKNVPLQTAIVDLMEAKTSFTTIGNAQMQLIYKVRNNNKQYMSVKLASESEVISVTRDGKPIKIVSSNEEGKIQIPLNMSKNYGVAAESEIKLLLKMPIKPLKRYGSLHFEIPLIDIPTSQFTWQIYVPSQYSAMNFAGNVLPFYSKPYIMFIFRGALVLLELVLYSFMEPVFFIMIILFIIVLIYYFARNFLIRILKYIYNSLGILTFRTYFRLFEIILVLAIIGVLAAIAIPNFRRSREQAKDKACHANCRALQGAVEMYNMDNSPQMSTLDIDLLIQKGYLRERPYCPLAGRKNTYYGFNLNSNGLVFCSIHGAPDLPNYGKEKPVASAFDKNLISETKLNLQVKDSKSIPQPTARDKGVLPVDVKFVSTSQSYYLQKSIIIPTINTDGILEPNNSTPWVKFFYIKNEILKVIYFLCFIAGYMIASNLISAVYFRSSFRLLLALILIGIVTFFDIIDQNAGSMANTGIFIAIVIGIIIQIIRLKKIENNKKSINNPNNPSNLNDYSINIDSNKTNSANIAYSSNSTTLNISKNNTETNTITKIIGINNLFITNYIKNTIAKAFVLLLILVHLLFFIALNTSNAQVYPDLNINKHLDEVKILVPFTDLASIVRKLDNYVILTYDEYYKLLPVQKATDILSVDDKLPISYSIINAHYLAKLSDKGLRFKANFKIALLKEIWHKIPLISSQVTPTEAYIDNEKLPLTYIQDIYNGCYGVYLFGSGTKDVSIEFFTPTATKEEIATKKFTLNLIPTYKTFLDIILPNNNYDLIVDPAIASSISSTSSNLSYNFIIPPTDKLEIELIKKSNISLQNQNISKPENENIISINQTASDVNQVISTITADVKEIPTRVSCKEHTLITFDETFIKGVSVYFITITGTSGISSISFEIPSSYRVVKVLNNNIEDWKLETSDQLGCKILYVTFITPVKGQSQIIIEYDIDYPQQSFETCKFDFIPVKIQSVDRTLGNIGFGCAYTLEIQSLENENLDNAIKPIDPSEFKSEFSLANVEKLPIAYKFTKAVDKISILVSRPKDVEQTTAVIDSAEAITLLTEEGFIITQIIYEIRNNSEQFLKLRFPPNIERDFELWSCLVNNQPVKAGYDEQTKFYNIPIVKSQIVDKEVRPFYAKIVFVQKIPEIKALSNLKIFLPNIHIDLSEVKWAIYLPKGYELLWYSGNLDPINPLTIFSLDYEFKSNKPSFDNVGFAGFLPVDFSIPVSREQTPKVFGMQQISTKTHFLHLNLNVFNPDKNKGRFIKWLVMLLGFIAGISFMSIFLSRYNKLFAVIFGLSTVCYICLVYSEIMYIQNFAISTFATAIFAIIFYNVFKPLDVSIDACNSEKEKLSV